MKREVFYGILGVVVLVPVIHVYSEMVKFQTNIDLYMAQITKKSWYVGCIHATNFDLAYCNELSKHIDFDLLTLKVKEVVKDESKDKR